MGLTVHYVIESETSDRDEALRLVRRMRSLAMDLPFARVGEIAELSGERADHNHPAYKRGGELADYVWMAIQVTQYTKAVGDPPLVATVAPLELIGFEIRPGAGCESANFGLCRYPARIVRESAERGREAIDTEIGGTWRWSTFCKTQYASDPKLGGMANFLRCHISLVTLVDRIGERLGLRVVCHDEGGFGSREDSEAEEFSADVFKRVYKPGHYNPAQLAAKVVQLNQWHAAFAGAIGDAMRSAGMQTQSAIGQFSNFEHLEFRGREKTGNLDAFLAALLKIIEKRGEGASPDKPNDSNPF
jgi:hypothetical protein